MRSSANYRKELLRRKLICAQLISKPNPNLHQVDSSSKLSKAIRISHLHNVDPAAAQAELEHSGVPK